MNDPIAPQRSPETDAHAAEPDRRKLLIGAAVAAASAGLGLAWWRSQTGQAKTVFEEFWTLEWDSPNGTPVRAQAFRGKPLLVNFWASWCPPCIEELPLISDFFRKNQANGWQVLALAVDRPAAVQGFLQKMPLEFPVGLAGTTGVELGNRLGNPAGSLPFSLVIGAQGDVLQRRLGRLRSEELDTWAQLK
jgi:thiol-disulfide isomerase/thioredoxin